jgi:hypothetical protein
MTTVVVIVVAIAFAAVLAAIVWTVAQGAARRAGERATAAFARDGTTVLRSAQVNLLGSTSLARTQIRGVGVLGLTDETIEFRLGYGTTAISIRRDALLGVTVGTSFSMRGRAKRMLKPWVLTMTWGEGELERKAGFSTRRAAEIAAWFTN